MRSGSNRKGRRNRMTDEQLRIRLTELVGWKKGNAPKNIRWGQSAPEGEYWFAHQLPNYPEDLNACHEIERGLTDEQHERYRSNLLILLRSCYYADRNYISATARQRTEALIRTLEQEKPNE